MTSQFIPLVDLNAQYNSLKSELDAAVLNVLARGDFILGKSVGEFESAFAAYCGVDHAIGCANGTDALHLALRALDVGPGDEVIVPAMTFIATALAVSLCGATPVLVDVEPTTALIDPALIEAAITDKTKAIIPVHLFGQCADMAAIQKIADKHGLKVVEDAAQAHGALFSDGTRAGTKGDYGCFSFYPGKNLGAYGDGGAVVTGDDGLAERLKCFRNLGSLKKHFHEVVGMNSRLDTVQAAFLSVKLPHLDQWNDARRRHAAAYNEALADIPGLTLTQYDSGTVFHLYVIRVENRDAVLKDLNDAGIGAGIHYPFAVHELEAYAHLGYAKGEFPAAEDWGRRCISLPIYAELPAEAASRAAAALRASLGGN